RFSRDVSLREGKSVRGQELPRLPQIPPELSVSSSEIEIGENYILIYEYDLNSTPAAVMVRAGRDTLLSRTLIGGNRNAATISSRRIGARRLGCGAHRHRLEHARIRRGQGSGRADRQVHRRQD